jgi:solute carrier family 25 (mitochondrial folate transporter), member 32
LTNDSELNPHLSTCQLIVASSVSKITASCIAYPHEIVRSRLQDAGHVQQRSSISRENRRQYRNVRDALRTISRDEGLRGFYRGLWPTLLRTVPAAILTLLSYEKMKDFLTERC